MALENPLLAPQNSELDFFKGSWGSLPLPQWLLEHLENLVKPSLSLTGTPPKVAQARYANPHTPSLG